MKNFKIIINCIIFALGLVNVVLLGYFCDEYPTVIVRNIVFISLYFIVFGSFANMLLLIIFQEKYSTKKIAKAVSLILLTIFIVLLVYEFSVYKKTINKYSRDYISASNINGVSLYEFQENFNSNEEVLFYIGREDCAECLSFENILNELLEQSNLVLPAYYTNLDRNGKKADEMYEFLDHIGVLQVPALVYKDNNGRIQNVPIDDSVLIKQLVLSLQ